MTRMRTHRAAVDAARARSWKLGPCALPGGEFPLVGAKWSGAARPKSTRTDKTKQSKDWRWWPRGPFRLKLKPEATATFGDSNGSKSLPSTT